MTGWLINCMKCSPVQMKGTKFSLILCLVCYTTRDGSFYFISSPKVNVLKLSGLFESHYVHHLSIACLLRVEIGGGRSGCQSPSSKKMQTLNSHSNIIKKKKKKA